MNRERGAQAKLQETIHLINSGSRWADKEKKVLWTDMENTHFGVISVLEADKERWEKTGVSSIEMYKLLLIMLSLP